jgi:hypothetical protein
MYVRLQIFMVVVVVVVVIHVVVFWVITLGSDVVGYQHF